MSDSVKTADLFSEIPDFLAGLFQECEYPWELLPKIKEYICTALSEGLQNFSPYSDLVLIGKNVRIHPNAVIEGTAIIGSGTEIRPGAFLRDNVIAGKNCVIGNSTELKNCILLDRVQVPHYNYIGDSILGNHAHLGAGAVCSNLKSDGKLIVVHGEQDYSTGLRKMGGILGDNAEIGCGCVLNPGTIVGQNTSVYPLTALRGIYAANRIVKNTGCIVIKMK